MPVISLGTRPTNDHHPKVLAHSDYHIIAPTLPLPCAELNPAHPFIALIRRPHTAPTRHAGIRVLPLLLWQTTNWKLRVPFPIVVPPLPYLVRHLDNHWFMRCLHMLVLRLGGPRQLHLSTTKTLNCLPPVQHLLLRSNPRLHALQLPRLSVLHLLVCSALGP